MDCMDKTKGVVMREVALAMEEVSGGRESFGDVGEHVLHRLVDASPIRAAVQPFAILHEGGEVDGLGGAVPAKVGKFCMDAEPVIERLCWVLRGHVGMMSP
jgi:hypothetical protein